MAQQSFRAQRVLRHPMLRADICDLATPSTMNHSNMLKTIQLAVIALAAVITVGCEPANEKPIPQQTDQVKTGTKETAPGPTDYTFAQKAEFTEMMRTQLAEINQDMDQLAAKIEKSSDEVKAAAKPKLQALREQKEHLNRQLEEAGNTTESTWESFKTGTGKAFDALKEGFKESRQWVSEKIAP